MAPPVLIAILAVIAVFIFTKPIRFALRVLINIGLGFAALIIINFIGESFGINIGVNWFNAVVTGVLGLPGVALLLILDWLAVL